MTTPPVGVPAADHPESIAAAADSYRLWGWPVSLRGDQVSLSLDRDVVAVIAPASLANKVQAILTERRCPAGLLTHPCAPEHRVLLAGEPYGVPLPWPSVVDLACGSLLLPPPMTPRGPVTWTDFPDRNALTLCREIDLFAAVRTLLRDRRRAAPTLKG